MNNAKNKTPLFNGFLKVLAGKLAGIKTKLILLFILFSVTPFIILAGISYMASRSETAGGLSAMIRGGVNGTSNSLELLMANIENKMTAISDDAGFRQDLLQLTAASLESGGNRQLLQKLDGFLEAKIGKDKYIARVMIVRGQNDSIHCSFNNREEYQTAIDSQWYRKALDLNDKFLWIGSHPELNTPNDYSLSCLQRIPHNRDNSQHDILIIDISSSAFSHILSRPFIESGGRVYLIDPARQVAATAKTNENITVLTSFRWPLIGGFGILLVIAAISGGFMFAKPFAGPVQQILAALKSAETGDLTQKVAVTRNDEIGIMAEAYNLMINSINQLITTIRNTIAKQKIAAQTISATAGELSGAISNIINTVHEVTQSVTQQATETSNSNNCMSDLAEKIDRVISNVNTIQLIAEGTKNMSVDGIKAIEDLSRDVTKTTTVTLSISEHLNTLNEETHQVTETISAINDIADRNNLLAMNAIIGAAKAGEAGKGFSVVANNVKKLAEKSMNSTREVSDFITDLQRRMAATVATSLNIDKTVVAQNQAFKASIQVFNQINALANNLTKKIEEILKLVNNMETSKTETLTSMENINLKSQQTASIMNEIYLTIQDQYNTVENLQNMSKKLLQVTDELEQVIQKFKTGAGLVS